MAKKPTAKPAPKPAPKAPSVGGIVDPTGAPIRHESAIHGGDAE